MRTPPAAAGPSPALALTYDSQSVDGESASTNNQPSAIGEGWSLSGGGFIQRTYVSCSVDNGSSGPVTTSGDLCWKTDNAMISVAGHSGLLVKDTSGVWKLQSDDGSRFEHLSGAAAGCGNATYDDDCWRMTTRDGTQYFFGRNQLPGWSAGAHATNSTWTVPVFGNDPGEPCHGATFTASACNQAWRWNLDYAVDVHGNAEALYYDAETNKYAQNGGAAVSYTRGGQLDHIDYGLSASNIYGANAAGDRVFFGYDAYGRCSDSAHTTCSSEAITAAATTPTTPASYPDVPFDQLCTAATCSQLSPTFFTDGMLDTVTTSALIAGAYQTVDAWAFGHSFPAPGDSTNAALWLTQATHTGSAAGQTSISEPPTAFSGTTKQNRVWAADGLAPLDKWRLASIQTSLGAVIGVNYSTAQCNSTNGPGIEASPWSNTNWCFPEWWTPGVLGAQTPREDLFNKYAVTSLSTSPTTGGGLDQAQQTSYVYGTPRWRYDTSPLTPDAYRTWNQFAGVDTLEIRSGDPNSPTLEKVTDDTFYQGMDGDRAGASGGTKSVTVKGTSVADARWFAGQVYEEKSLLGVGGSVLSDAVQTPWASAVTANDGTSTARMTAVQDTVVTQPLSTGGNRSSDTKTTFDATYGYPTSVSTIPTDNAPRTCTTSTYTAANAAAWIVGLPSEVKKVGVDCASLGTAVYPRDLIGDVRNYYDSGALGTVGNLGGLTSTSQVDSYSGTTAHWTTASTTTYDALGRVATSKDVLGHTTSTTYVPSGSAPLTSKTVTNTLGWTSTTAYNPEWGAALSTTDQNGHVTTATYDALGRRSQVWLPQNTQAANPASPSVAYTYTLSQSAPNVVQTTTLLASGNNTQFVLYDGLGRKVQTQAPADGSSGGTAVSTTGYGPSGQANWQDNAYWTTSVTPSGTLFVPTTEASIPSQIRTTFDAAGRATATSTWESGTKRFETDQAFSGADRVDTTPPSGGTSTSVFTNSGGQKTKLTQKVSSSVSQSTVYNYDAAGHMTAMTDPAGNAWSWSYDVLGHQVLATDPDAGATSSTYDDAGNLLSTTDARAQTLSYTYDALNRKTAEYAGTTGGALLTSWVYDTVAKGDLTSSTSYTGSVPGTPGLAYSTTIGGYDAADKPTSQTVTIPAGAPAFAGTSYTVSLTYGADESLIASAEPSAGGLPAETVKTSYTGDGQVNGVSATGVSTVVQYTPIGQPGSVNRFIPPPLFQSTKYSAYSAYGYDAATGALANITDNAMFAAAGHPIANRTYTRDDAGDVTSVTNTATYPSSTTQVDCYNYDGLGELTQAFTPGGSSTCATTPSQSILGGPAPLWDTYTYDTVTGNRTGETVHATATSGTTVTGTYGYPAAHASRPHTVSTITGTSAPGVGSYTYDAAGHTLTLPDHTLTYDAHGKPATITTHTGTQQNIYDASGGLLLQLDPGQGAALFLGDTVLHQTGTSPITGVRTYSGPTGPLVERTATAGVTGSTLTWLFTDIDGTVDIHTDALTGTTTNTYRDPFGNPITGTGIWSDGNAYLNHPTTADTSLTTLGARQYNPTTGRFLTPDPILATGDPQQTNGYAYANNNPITLTDPTGLDPIYDSCRGSNMGKSCWDYMYGGSTTPASTISNSPDPIGAYIKSEGLPPDFNPVAAAACGWMQECVNSQPNRWAAGPGYNPAPGSLAKCEEACQAIATFTTLTLLTIALPELGIPADIAEASSAAGESAVLGGEEGATLAANELAGNTEVEASLYRGVAHTHPGYENALRGAAHPRGGAATAAEHNAGNTLSEYTSWTTDPSVASDMSYPGGVMLRIPRSAVEDRIVVSPDVYDEAEVLIRGPVTGAEVLP